MVKYGQNIKAESQLCFNHAIHLCVIDVIYKVKNFNNLDVDSVSEKFSSDEYNDSVECESIYSNLELNVTHDIMPEIALILLKWRRIIKIFKKSPLKNDLLQQHVILQEGRQLSQILDCVTRWNSLVKMLERFLLLKILLKKH
jgi:hypothetical protein